MKEQYMTFTYYIVGVLFKKPVQQGSYSDFNCVSRIFVDFRKGDILLMYCAI